jgi:hypothetical protein
MLTKRRVGLAIVHGGTLNVTTIMYSRRGSRSASTARTTVVDLGTPLVKFVVRRSALIGGDAGIGYVTTTSWHGWVRTTARDSNKGIVLCVMQKQTNRLLLLLLLLFGG